MSNPNQPDEHGRTGGVRGAINDLLGRNDRPENDRATTDRATTDRANTDRANTDPTADDRTAESERLMQERSGSAQDAGTAAPTGARFDGQPVDDRVAADPRPDAQAPAGAPTGARFEGQHADPQATDPRVAQQPLDAPTGARFDGQPAEQQRHGGAGVVGAAAAEQHTVGDRRPDPAAETTPGSARHTDVGPGGPGYSAPAGGHTVDTGHADASAATGPVTTDRNDAARHDTARNDTAPARDDHATGHDGGGNHATTTPSGSGAGSVAQTSQGEDSSGRERLVSTDRAESYGSRWDAVKGQFVDEPRKAVADADALVGELLDELQTLFTEQRKGIERSMAADETSTEDMRLALRRYRSFFDRLLSI